MATLATVLDKLFENQNRPGRTRRAPRSRRAQPVRPFANEDIFFHVKRIDNSRVVRAADPAGAPGLLEDDRLGGGGGRAADRRAASQRLRSAGGLSDSISACRKRTGWPTNRLRSNCRKPSCFRRRAWRNWRATSSSSIRRRRKWCTWMVRGTRRWRRTAEVSREPAGETGSNPRGRRAMPLSPTTQRLQWLLWVLLAWAGIIFGRLVWLQVIRHDELLRLAEQQQQKNRGSASPARVHLRSHRAAAGEDLAGRIDRRQSAEDSGSQDRGRSAFPHSGSWIGPSCTNGFSAYQVARQPFHVGEAQAGRRSRPNACAA